MHRLSVLLHSQYPSCCSMRGKWVAQFTRLIHADNKPWQRLACTRPGCGCSIFDSMQAYYLSRAFCWLLQPSLEKKAGTEAAYQQLWRYVHDKTGQASQLLGLCKLHQNTVSHTWSLQQLPHSEGMPRMASGHQNEASESCHPTELQSCGRGLIEGTEGHQRGLAQERFTGDQ